MSEECGQSSSTTTDVFNCHRLILSFLFIFIHFTIFECYCVISIDGYYGVYVRPPRRHVYAHNWWAWLKFRRARSARTLCPPFLKILATRLRVIEILSSID